MNKRFLLIHRLSLISLFHDSTPPIGKCVVRRNGMYDDLDTNWGEFAIKNPLNPARRKHRTRSDTHQRGNSAVTKSRLGLWLLVADHPAD